MELKSFTCPKCNAPLEPLKDSRFMFCPYCGTKIIIDDIEYYREDSKTQREKIRADGEVRKAEVEHNAAVEQAREKHKAEASENKNDMILILGLFGMAFLMIIVMTILSAIGLVN